MSWTDRTGTNYRICCIFVLHFCATHPRVETQFQTDALIHSQNNVHWPCSWMNWHDSAMHTVIRTLQMLKVKLRPNAIKQHKVDMPMASRSSVPKLELHHVAGWVTGRPAKLYNLNLHRSSYLGSKAVSDIFKALGQNSWHDTSAKPPLRCVATIVVPTLSGRKVQR